MTQEKLDAVWQRFLETGQCEKGFACISNGRLHHITEYASDTTWERKKASPEWKPVFPIRSSSRDVPNTADH